MKVILLKELKGRGGEGDVIDVAQGFAVNYLIPQGIAIQATKGELKQLEQRRHNIEKRELARTTDANKLKEALDGKTLRIVAKVGEEGQLFGSVTTTMLSEAISEQIGATIDRKKIDVGRPIKTAGDHQVTVSIYRDIKATLNVTVVSDDIDLDVVKEVETAEQTAEGEEASAAEEVPAEQASEEAPVEGAQEAAE